MPRPDRARLRASWQRWVLGAVSGRTLYKAVALFLALVLWLVVNAEEPTEDVVPVRFSVDFDSTLLTLRSAMPPMHASVVGRARDVNRLHANPPEVQRSIPPDAVDSVRFELTPADVQPPTGLEGDIRVRRVDPSVVTLHFTARVRKRVPVRPRLRVSVDTIFRQVGGAQIIPDSVTIVGTRERVDSVESIPTELTDVRVRDTLGVFVPLDTTGLGVQVSPPRVRVRVPVARDTLYSMPAATLPWGRPRFVPPRPP